MKILLNFIVSGKSLVVLSCAVQKTVMTAQGRAVKQSATRCRIDCVHVRFNIYISTS
jgi:hypothetical protein